MSDSEVMKKLYKPGQKVEAPGIYLVTHDPSHARDHDVTVVFGTRFPPCRNCDHPRFKAVRLARHIETSKYFES